MSFRTDHLDLRDILSFQPQGGVIRFLGQRIVMLDAVALGLLRKELIDTFGLSAARGILTRIGYAHGWRLAQALKEGHPDLWAEGKAGPFLSTLSGQYTLEESIRTDGAGTTPLVQTTWTESYEAEQHLLHLGRSEDPVCWTTAGFASGYVSYKEGREVYFIEEQCVGRGDPHCHVVARFRENWGPDLQPQLDYFHVQSIDAVLHQLSTGLRSTERRLHETRRELDVLQDQNGDRRGIVARSDAMRGTLERAQRFARTDSSVLITGESGAGKEVVARFIHAESARAAKPFLSLNCGAVPESLLESELFGHVKGAFTGAQTASVGVFEAANGATLFLDEIGEISPAMQVKLLRVLQEKEIRRVGESCSRPVDVRVVSATNRDLSADVQAGRFRRDLYYRLHVLTLSVPPLRQRPADILPLARFFMRKMGISTGRPACGLSTEVADRLLRYPWPGNVRELQSAIEHAMALCDGSQVLLDDLPEDVRNAPPAPRSDAIRPLDEVEREHILAAMRATCGCKHRAADALGIGLATLYRKLKQFGATA